MGEITAIIGNRGLNAGQTAPFSTPDDFGAGAARAIAGAGQSLTDQQKMRDEFANMEASVNADTAASQLRIDWQKRIQDEQTNFSGDPTKFADNLDQEFQADANNRLRQAKNAREAFLFKEQINSIRNSVFNDNFNFETRERQGQVVSNFKIANENDIQNIANGGDFNAAMQRINDRTALLDMAGVSGGDITNFKDNLTQQANLAAFSANIKKTPSTALQQVSGQAPINTSDLFDRLVKQESAGNPNAESDKGAIGLAQIIPSTARGIARDMGLDSVANLSEADLKTYLQNPDNNKKFGQFYLSQLLDRYNGNQTLALAAYNGGYGNVDKWLKEIGDPRTGQITNKQFADSIPFKETSNYVNKILGLDIGDGSANPYFNSLKGQYREDAIREANRVYEEDRRNVRVQSSRFIESAVTALRNGLPLSEEQRKATSLSTINYAFDPVEAANINRQLTQAATVGDFKNFTNTATNKEIGEALTTFNQTIDSTSPDYTSQLQTQKELNDTAKIVQSARQTDPNGYILSTNQQLSQQYNQAIQSGDPQAFAVANKTVQEIGSKLGIANLNPLPNAIAASTAASLNDQLARGQPEQVRATLLQLQNLVGPTETAPLMSQLVKNGANEVVMSGVIYDRPQDSAIVQSIFNIAGIYKDVEKRLGTEKISTLKNQIMTDTTYNRFIDALPDDGLKNVLAQNYYLAALTAYSSGKSEQEAVRIANDATWSKYNADAVKNYGVFIRNDNPTFNDQYVNSGIELANSLNTLLKFDNIGSQTSIPKNYNATSIADLLDYRRARIAENVKFQTGPDEKSVQLYFTTDNGTREPVLRNGKNIIIPMYALNAVGIRSNLTSLTLAERVHLSDVLLNHPWGEDEGNDMKAYVDIANFRATGIRQDIAPQNQNTTQSIPYERPTD